MKLFTRIKKIAKTINNIVNALLIVMIISFDIALFRVFNFSGQEALLPLLVVIPVSIYLISLIIKKW